MPKDNVLLINLQEDQSKELAKVLGNNTCRKIMDLLSQGEATESEIAEKLSIPISTVHYNLQQLLKGQLVVTDEFHYSKKGREVLHYKMANRYIVIAPVAGFNFREKIKRVLPVAVLIIAATAVLKYIYPTTLSSVQEAGIAAAPMMADSLALAKSAPVPEAMQVVQSEPNLALWFALGASLALVVYVLGDYLFSRIK